jgi:hypothetical protein
MKRLFLMFVAALAVTALVAGTGAASDTKGPPCTNVINGDAGYVRDASNDSGTVQIFLTLDAPACAEGSFLTDIYDAGGSPLLVGDLEPSSVSGDLVTFTYSFAPGTAPDNGVCVVSTTFYKKHLADRAPDEGCVFLEPTGSGASGYG